MRLSAMAVLCFAASLSAQERRSAPGDQATQSSAPARLVLPTIRPDSARPFVGVWQGDFHGPYGDTQPMSLAVEFVNGVYAGYSAEGPMVRLHAHATDSIIGDTLQWTQPNNGGGTLVFRAHRTGANTLTGTMDLRGGPAELQQLHPTFTLRRVRP